MSKRVETRTGVSWVDEELGLLRFEYAQGTECTLEDARENVEAQVDLCEGETLPILVDVAGVKAIDQAARSYYGESKAFPALALVGEAPIGRIIGNIFLAIYGSRDTPTRFFKSEDEAVAWLRGFLP